MHFNVSGLHKPESEKQFHQILFGLCIALFEPKPRGRHPQILCCLSWALLQYLTSTQRQLEPLLECFKMMGGPRGACWADPRENLSKSTFCMGITSPAAIAAGKTVGLGDPLQSLRKFRRIPRGGFLKSGDYEDLFDLKWTFTQKNLSLSGVC